jgi:hypothetical protein
MRASVLVVALLLAGCTFEDGRGFARLSGELWSHFAGTDPKSGRLQTDGWFKTDNSFELRLTRLELEVKSIELLALQAAAPSSGGSCSFDPSNPPAGCTLCHGGHCHCDGALKSYAELEAQVCGGGAGQPQATTLGSLPVDEVQPLLGSGTRSQLLTCEPSCELPAGDVSRVRLTLGRLRLAGKVRDLSLQDRLGGVEPAVTVDRDLSGAALEAELATHQHIDRHHAYHLDLSVELPVTEKLLDGIDWHTLDGAASAITINKKTNTTAGEALTTSLGRSTLEVSVARKDD